MSDDASSGDQAEQLRPMTPPRRHSGAMALLARAALGLLALVLVAFFSHPWWLGPALGRYLTAASGRDVHFDSIRLGLSPSLAPVAHLRGVRIANAPWAESKEPFAELGDAVFVFDWLHFENRQVVRYLLMRDGAVRLELRADGLRNWRLADPEDRGPGHFWFYSLEAHAASLAFTNHANELRFVAAASDASKSSPAPAALPASSSASASSASLPSPAALPTRIDFDGSFRQVAFRGSVLTSPVLSFLETERWFGVRGHAAIEGVDLQIDGRAANILRATQIDADVHLAGRSLKALRPFVGERYAEPRVFRAQGHLRSDALRYSLSAAEAQVGATDLAGELVWSRNGTRRVVRARVKSSAADLDDLLWLTGRPPAAVAHAASAVASGAAPPGGRDLFAAARELDADIAFDATRFRAAAWRALQSLKLKAELAAGQLAISELDAGWAGGHTTGRLGLDLRQPIAAADVTLDTRGIRVETLLGAQEEKKRITGALRSHVALKANGNTIEALRSSAAGTVAVSLADGTISSLLDAELGLEGGKLMRTLISGVEFLPLPCAVATVDVRGGKARIRKLVVDSANTRTTGSGSIDLHDAAIDVLLTPQPKRPGLFELQRSIHLFGHLPKPQRALVDRVEPPAGATCEAAGS